jgi:hypothetical protein
VSPRVFWSQSRSAIELVLLGADLHLFQPREVAQLGVEDRSACTS